MSWLSVPQRSSQVGSYGASRRCGEGWAPVCLSLLVKTVGFSKQQRPEMRPVTNPSP